MAFNIFNTDTLTALAVRMKKGDRKAAAALYDELSTKVYGFFFARTGRKETAEDLSQDIFVRLVEKVESYDETRGRFVVWFWRMARNLLIDHYRGKKETPFSSFSEDEVEGMAVMTGTSPEDRERHRTMQAFLKTLDKEEQELFELRYVAEVPYREIAELLGRSEGSLRVAALRLKEKIKKELKDEI